MFGLLPCGYCLHPMMCCGCSEDPFSYCLDCSWTDWSCLGGLTGCLAGGVGVTGMCEGLWVALGGLVSCMGAVTGGVFQCCSDVINCCGAVC